MEFHLNSLINRLRVLRQDEEYYKSVLKSKEEAFLETVKEDKYFLTRTMEDRKGVEANIRNLALELYEKSDKANKDINQYVKERDVLDFIYEDEEALKWSIDHKLFLMLNKTAFTSYLRSLKGKGYPSFVTAVSRETITIASDLG